MVFPEYTRTGRKSRTEWLKEQLAEIGRESKFNPEIYPDWLPMVAELADYVFALEKRITELEDE